MHNIRWKDKNYDRLRKRIGLEARFGLEARIGLEATILDGISKN